jgi:hypothetical protein
MPVRKFRSVADMPDPPRVRSARDGLAAACALSDVSRAFGHTARAPRGVRKFKSVQEADEHRRAWESRGPSDG